MKDNNNKIFQEVEYGINCQFAEYCLVGVTAKQSQKNILKIGNYAIIRSHSVLYIGSVIGDNFTTGHHVLIREDCVIKDDVSIGSSSVIEHHVTIDNNVNIHSQVFIPEYTVIKCNVWIGPNVVFTNAKYPKSFNVKNNLKGALVAENAKIGANSTILPNVSIGANSLIGAGSVVTKDVPNNAVVAGNPAKIINNIQNLPYGYDKYENSLS